MSKEAEDEQGEYFYYNMNPEELDDERQKKIKEYEDYINEHLKVDLKHVLEYRDKIFDQIAK